MITNCFLSGRVRRILPLFDFGDHTLFVVCTAGMDSEPVRKKLPSISTCCKPRINT